MISLAPIFSSTCRTIGYLSRPLLGMSLCVLMVGCDSASSNIEKDISTKVATVDEVKEAGQQSTEQAIQEAARPSVSDATAATEGQSLIAAAQSSNDSYYTPPSSSDDSAASNYSSLQATLMGDYGGMVPCPSCDSIDVTLNLFSDGSVRKTSIYNNTARTREPLYQSGIYRQDDDKITIVYENENLEVYHIQDNHLVLMSADDTPDNDYTLSLK
ncbi:copper resistance protein NlpE N-terminal domain-containing protein [Psychrobacter sp.]|uniref:copper resistance protein NlpE N-terminal domain-containing protein n=1 Tax=Psychrobacter sp. TaxID=56811 RepID=UPI002648214C|nr:copper resistance protein NlpE N-terminal domain-containing protein [Psychrobacter sp.]MDN6307705.1 copper resistance protein NlpE [Psychrobacter sp.]